MIKSMTGFGKAEVELKNKKISIEIKSLNSKQLDINTRIPALYKEKDIEIRKEISEQLSRGKVDLNIYVENLGEETNSTINSPVVKNYFDQISEISNELNIPVSELSMQTVIRLPDAIKVEYEELDETEWNTVFEQIKKALIDVNQFRIQEGKSLELDLSKNIRKIQSLLDEIKPFEKARIENIRKRLQESLDSLKLNGNVDENRFEQELIFYVEKLDINEEKVRLKNHCEYYLETLAEPESSGKKLGFISQEIGREINTIGSKANESNIQRIVVQMKDHLERIKEQVLNVL